MPTKISNITDLINDLSRSYEALRGKKLSIPQAKEIANLAGKIIKSVSVQLKYNEYMKKTERIPFLESSKAA